ncbi:MAG: hypothetical protein GXO26_01215 [Crenarchaeota archaeon]|nr:hypothetical protein [Thermoproteota archaeon]
MSELADIRRRYKRLHIVSIIVLIAAALVVISMGIFASLGIYILEPFLVFALVPIAIAYYLVSQSKKRLKVKYRKIKKKEREELSKVMAAVVLGMLIAFSHLAVVSFAQYSGDEVTIRGKLAAQECLKARNLIFAASMAVLAALGLMIIAGILVISLMAVSALSTILRIFEMMMFTGIIALILFVLFGVPLWVVIQVQPNSDMCTISISALRENGPLALRFLLSALDWRNFIPQSLLSNTTSTTATTGGTGGGGVPPV